MKFAIISVLVVVGFVYGCNHFGISSLAVVKAGITAVTTSLK